MTTTTRRVLGGWFVTLRSYPIGPYFVSDEELANAKKNRSGDAKFRPDSLTLEAIGIGKRCGAYRPDEAQRLQIAAAQMTSASTLSDAANREVLRRALEGVV